jgi:TIR domain
MGRAIFISYRRDDTEGEAGRLFDDLVRKFGEDSVFMDVAGINPGVDFRKAIDDNVANCGVLLAIIGPTWGSIKNANEVRRLDDPNDFVRLEIGSALARDVAVIPVLVHDAKMPRPEDLPESLKDLAFRNSVEITHARWNSDVQLLIAALGRYVAPTAATDTAPVHATVAVQLPPPTSPGQKERSSASNVPLMLGIVAAVVVALGIVGFILFRPNPVKAFLGTWTNSTPVEQNGLEKLEVSTGGREALTIHAWGKCGQLQCDWGTQPATVSGEQAQASWQLGTDAAGGDARRTAAIVIKPDNDQLAVTVSNTYPDHPANQHEFTFAKAQQR